MFKWQPRSTQTHVVCKNKFTEISGGTYTLYYQQQQRYATNIRNTISIMDATDRRNTTTRESHP